MNSSINYKDVCRTAPATQGLLKRAEKLKLDIKWKIANEWTLPNTVRVRYHCGFPFKCSQYPSLYINVQNTERAIYVHGQNADEIAIMNMFCFVI